MYKFTLVIGLKNGQMITGVYETSKSGSVDVAKELIPDAPKRGTPYPPEE